MQYIICIIIITNIEKSGAASYHCGFIIGLFDE